MYMDIYIDICGYVYRYIYMYLYIYVYVYVCGGDINQDKSFKRETDEKVDGGKT